MESRVVLKLDISHSWWDDHGPHEVVNFSDKLTIFPYFPLWVSSKIDHWISLVVLPSDTHGVFPKLQIPIEVKLGILEFIIETIRKKSLPGSTTGG